LWDIDTVAIVGCKGRECVAFVGCKEWECVAVVGCKGRECVTFVVCNPRERIAVVFVSNVRESLAVVFSKSRECVEVLVRKSGRIIEHTSMQYIGNHSVYRFFFLNNRRGKLIAGFERSGNSAGGSHPLTYEPPSAKYSPNVTDRKLIDSGLAFEQCPVCRRASF